MSKIQFDYYYGIESDKFEFFRIPKSLFEPYFENLSIEAKMLYGLMLDRMSLSRCNKWLDDENRVYIIFTRKQIMNAMKCAIATARKLTNELIEYDLIEMQSLGAGKTDIIYVKNFANDELLDHSENSEPLQNLEGVNIQSSKNKKGVNNNTPLKNAPLQKKDQHKKCTGAPTRNDGEPLQNLTPINNKNNQIKNNNNESSVDPDIAALIDDRKIIRKVRENIKYDIHSITDSKNEFEIYQRMFWVIVNVLSEKTLAYESVKIGNKEVLFETVKQKFEALREEHLVSVQKKVLAVDPKTINNMEGYLKVALLNEIDNPAYKSTKSTSFFCRMEKSDYDFELLERARAKSGTA